VHVRGSSDAVVLRNLSYDVRTKARDLTQIDATIASLSYVRKLFEGTVSFIQEFIEHLPTANECIDPDGDLESDLLKAQEEANSLHGSLIKKLDAARRDTRLTDEDGLEEEFLRTIDVVVQIHNVLNSLRWCIGEHDANLLVQTGEVSPELKSSEDIKSFLRSL